MPISKKRLAELNQISDDDIDTSDNAELDDQFWNNAKVVLPKRQASISLRVDQEVLDWFKSSGRGYQTRMNAVLRSYMEAHQKK